MKSNRINYILKNRNAVFCLLLPVQFFIIKLLSAFPSIIEKYYSSGIYIPISKILRFLTGWFPFPIGQIFVIYFIIYIIYSIIKIIRLKQFKTVNKKSYILKIGAITSVTYFLFITVWGLNYSRTNLSTILEIEKSTITLSELEKTCIVIIDSTNSIRDRLSTNTSSPISFDLKWNDFTQECSDGFNSISNSKFNYSTPSVKKVIGSKAMSYLGLGGIYFPFTGEANVNSDLPSYSIPFTTCHEIAHQIGFAKEDEANYVSFLVCSNHPNQQFRYSAYLAMLKYCMSELHYQNEESFEKIRLNYNQGVLTDLMHNKAYWQSYQSPLYRYSSTINDAFLKANNQADGAESYNLVVRLLVNDFKKKGLL